MILTPKSLKEAKAEYAKCKADPTYFICDYVYVTHPVRGVVPFNLYPFQCKIIDNLQKHRFNIIKKFRQAGITTIAAAYSLWNIIFKESFSVLVISIGDRESQEFLKRVKDMYHALPEWIKPKTESINKHELHLETKSYVRSLPSTASAGRGFSASLLMVDEAAFIDGMDKFWAAVWPVLSTGGGAFVISTVNGYGNFYHSKWVGAVEGKNEFNPIEIFWQEHPEYAKPGWEESTRSGMSKKQWLQEYCVTSDTIVKVRDLNTGEVCSISIGELQKSIEA